MPGPMYFNQSALPQNDLFHTCFQTGEEPRASTVAQPTGALLPALMTISLLVGDDGRCALRMSLEDILACRSKFVALG